MMPQARKHCSVHRHGRLAAIGCHALHQLDDHPRSKLLSPARCIFQVPSASSRRLYGRLSCSHSGRSRGGHAAVWKGCAELACTDQNLMGVRAMTDPSARMRPKQLCFDRYVLDLDRGCLLLDGNEIVASAQDLRGPAIPRREFRPSRSKDELFAAVWPNLAVTDDALVQSIGELRRALGDDGPRLIRTIPRRGYRFESDVSVIAPIDPPVADAPLAAGPPDDGARVVGARHPGSCIDIARDCATSAGAADCSPLWLS